jgi:hypothetical protein
MTFHRLKRTFRQHLKVTVWCYWERKAGRSSGHTRKRRLPTWSSTGILLIYIDTGHGILSHHTSTNDVGKIATEAKAKNLVLVHFIPPDDQTLTEQFWIDAVKKNYSGNSIVGKDLLNLPL